MDAKDTASNQSLNNLEELIEATIQNLRRLIRDLRPIYLEDLGLVTALEMATQDAHNEAQVHFQRLGAEQRLPAHTELTLYRMVQEALNNLNRHAYASQAWVTVSFSTQQLELQVRDDGQGFTVPKSPAEFAVSGHYGLLGLQERAELIGARLTIASSPGQGTTLTISLPLATASRKEA